MSEHMLPGDPPVRVILRRSARARRYSLRVSRLDGRVTITMPQRASATRALDFVREKEGWIRERLAERPATVLADLGSCVPIGGQPFEIVRAKRSAIDPATRRIAVSARARSVPAAVGGLLKALARERLAAQSDRFSARLGRPYSGLTIRDTRSRWGSCSHEGALMYSWRLVMAPDDILTYVAAHEVAHLAEMNHGPRFWATVEELWPEYRAHRSWLRENGEDLHRYRFAELPH